MLCVGAYVEAAHAQSNIYDNCKTLITDGLREYSIVTESEAYLNSVFDRYCDSSGSAKSSSFGVGLDAVVKAIPVKFTANYGSNEEAVRNFCRNYATVSTGRRDTGRYQEKIVQRTYDSFDQCVSLAQTGVIAHHKIHNLEVVDFYLAPGRSRPVIVKGVQATKNVECRGQDPNSEDSKDVKFDLSSRVELSNNKTLNIVCTRSSETGQNGEKIFEEAVITLLTDLSPNGNYAAFIPRDVQLPETRASEIEAALQGLEGRLQEVNDVLEREVAADKFTFATTGEDCLPPFRSLGQIGWLLNQQKYEKIGVGPKGGTFPPNRAVDHKAEYIWIHPFLCGR